MWRVAVVCFLALIHLGMAEAIPYGYWLPNLCLAYLLVEGSRLDPPSAAWLGVATGLAQALTLTAPLGVEPTVLAIVGGLASLAYRNPLRSRVLLPFLYGVTGCIAYQLLVNAAAWLRWGYPLLSGRLFAEGSISVLLTACLIVAFMSFGNGSRIRVEA